MAYNGIPNWRLSRIEEELERLSVSSPSSEDIKELGSRSNTLGRSSLPSSREGTLGRNSGREYVPERKLSLQEAQLEQQIYSKIIIKPAYKPEDNDPNEAAVKRFTEKYDSLGKVRPSAAPPVPPDVGYNTGQNPGYNTGQNTGYNTGQITGYNTGHNTGGELDNGNHQSVVEYDDEPLPPPPPEFIQPQADLGRTPGWCQNKTKPRLSEQDVLQIEMFYRSHKTDVHVCQGIAKMYFGTVSKSSPTQSPIHQVDSDNWTFVKIGVPLLVLDSGESRRYRKLNFVLAETGTGFTLWKDVVNHLTNYKAQSGNFHTMHLSNDHTKMAGFKFEDAGAASEFMTKFTAIVSNPDDDILNLSSSKKKRRKDKSKGKYKAPNKATISSPCGFTHITKLERTDGVSLLGPVTSPPKPAPTMQMSPVKMQKVSHLIRTDT